MTPPEPANDERPPLWPGMSRRTEERIGFWFSMVGLTIGAACILIFAKPSTLWIIGITVGLGFVVMLVGGLLRALISGRS
jgi:hypothetical protein